MKTALLENKNPPLEVSATNFFDIRFYKRIPGVNLSCLSPHQMILWDIIKERQIITKKEVATLLKVSEDTALRNLKELILLGLIEKKGTGKATFYSRLSNYQKF